MPKFEFEFNVSQTEAVHQAQFDRDKAIRVLEMMLPYLEERKPMPAVLAKHLAAAIRASLASAKPDRTLAEHLYLRQRAGRPGLDMIAVAEAVEKELRAGASSINEAAERVRRRAAFVGVDVSTIKRHHRQYLRLLSLAVQSSNDPNPETRWQDS